MTESENNTAQDPENPSGVDKLLSRFGPVPQSGPRQAPGPRRAPGPRGPSEVARPTQGRTVHPATKPSVETPAPLFDGPRDEVFGQSPAVATIERTPEAPAAVVTTALLDADEPPVEIIDRRDWVRVPRRSGPLLRFFIVAFVVFLGVTAVYGRVTSWWGDQYDPPGEPGSPVEFAIPSGATANDVTQDLYAEGVIANPTLFRYWLADNLDGDFQAGDYTCLQENMSFDEALECLDGQGPVPPTFFSVTIPEGLRLTEIIDVLNRENPGFDKAGLRRDLLADLVSVELSGVPDRVIPDSPDPTNSGLEGLLFPATYQIDEKEEDNTLDILRRMADEMESRYTSLVESEGRSPIIEELELTDYEVIIIASLIEEEYLIDEDLGRISAVIYNRLLNGRFSLGIDATACYAAQKPCADLNQADLDSESPWNTRNLQNYDLPPTPIAAPGEKALRAALNPDVGDWLYYVRTEEDGGHTFAVTDAEFNAAKAICVERGYC